MKLKTKEESKANFKKATEHSKVDERIFSKDYVDFLSDAGWRLEKILPSNKNNYSELLEDTDWKSNNIDIRSSKHYRRDLDALS